MKVRHRVLGFLFFLSIITYLDRVALSAAALDVRASLGIDAKDWGWILGAFSISYAAFEIPSGAMGDRLGPRRVLTRIVLWWSAFTSLTGAAVNFWMLWIVRFLFGAGEAGAYPNSASSISRWFPSTERARATSVVWMASRVGGALTPWIVYPLQASIGWRWTFVVLGGVGAVWALLWFLWYRDTPQEKPGVTSEEMAEIGAGGLKRAHVSLPWGRVLGDRNFLMILGMYHFYCWGSYFYLTWLHTYLEKGRGMTREQTAIWSTLPFVVGATANLFGGFLSDALSKRFGFKIGRRAVGAAGLALSAVLMLATSLTADNQLAAIFLALSYGAMDCMLPVAWAVCLDVGRKYAGAVSGAMNMAGQIGSFLSTVVFGYIIQYLRTPAGEPDYNRGLTFFSVMLGISALMFLAIDPTRQLVKEDEHVPELEPAGAARV